MRALVFTDIHADKKIVMNLIKKSSEVDVVICCGDISIFGRALKLVLKDLSTIDKMIFIIPGNHEDEDEFEKECSKYKNIINVHKKVAVFDDYLITGFGGGGFARREKELDELNKKMSNVIKQNKKHKKILITHAPPYKTSLDLIHGEHCGNKSINDFLKKYDFEYLFCGHIHENFNTIDTIKKTICMNPGPNGTIVDL